MILQMHDDEIRGEEQAAIPVENKQTATSLEGRSGPTPVWPRRWVSLLMYFLGVVLPMVAGSMVGWPWWVGDIFDAEWVLNTVVLVMALSVFAGAFLLRSWWAFLIVPVAWIVGEILGAALAPFVQGGWPALQAASENHLLGVQGMILLFAAAPLFFYTLCGVVCGIAFERWLKKRKSQR